MDFSNILPIEELPARISQAIESKEPIIIKTDIFSHDQEMYVEQVLAVFLSIIQQEQLRDYAIYFVKELMVNAKKANTKRVYFLEKGLDIDNIEDYRQGMKHFGTETFENVEHYLTLQKEKGLFIELHLEKRGKAIIIEVWNNAEITAIEEKRILNKIKTGEQYGNLEDAMGETLDDTEGAGLGLIILILMMKKMEVWNGRRSITIKKKSGNTIARVRIPIKIWH